MYIMKLINLLIIGLLSALIVLTGCGVEPGKSVAGQAIKTTSDLNKGDTILLSISPGVIDVLEYKGADTISTRGGKVRFKSLSTGDTIDFPIANGQITLTVGSESHSAKLTKNSINSPLQVDYYGGTDHQVARLHWS